MTLFFCFICLYFSSVANFMSSDLSLSNVILYEIYILLRHVLQLPWKCLSDSFKLTFVDFFMLLFVKSYYLKVVKHVTYLFLFALYTVIIKKNVSSDFFVLNCNSFFPTWFLKLVVILKVRETDDYLGVQLLFLETPGLQIYFWKWVPCKQENTKISWNTYGILID